MPLLRASNTVIKSVYPSQILPSGAIDGNVLQYKSNVNGWIPASLETIVRTITNSYQIQLVDEGCVLRINSTSNVVITVPHDSIANIKVGAQVIVIQEGTGRVTFNKATGVSLFASDQRYKLYGQWSGAALIKLQPNMWFLGGDISDT